MVSSLSLLALLYKQRPCTNGCSGDGLTCQDNRSAQDSDGRADVKVWRTAISDGR
jgi:hypothetical protein